MKSSVIFQFGMKLLLPFLLLMSFWIFWRGHQMPGGGFIGGLVAGASLAAYCFCFGVTETLARVRMSPLAFIFSGLFFALISGILSSLSGVMSAAQNLEPFTGLWGEVPLIGKLGTPMLFDFGVYLLVIGFVLVFVTETLKVSHD